MEVLRKNLRLHLAGLFLVENAPRAQLDYSVLREGFSLRVQSSVCAHQVIGVLGLGILIEVVPR